MLLRVNIWISSRSRFKLWAVKSLMSCAIVFYESVKYETLAIWISNVYSSITKECLLVIESSYLAQSYREHWSHGSPHNQMHKSKTIKSACGINNGCESV